MWSGVTIIITWDNITKVMSHQFENIVKAMIVSKFHVLNIKREIARRNTMMFDQTLFGKRPETLKSVDVDFATAETTAVVDLQMAVTAEHQ